MSTTTEIATLSFDNLSRVDASARFGFPSSSSSSTEDFPSVLVSLTGPIAPLLSQEKPNKSTLEVYVRPLSNVPGTQEKFFAGVLGPILECAIVGSVHPRTLLQVVVQVLAPQRRHSGVGSNLWRDKLLASMVNASTLAFLNASSIPLRGVLCAVSVGMNGDGKLITNPSEEEAGNFSASGCFAFLFSDVTSATCVWSNWRSFNGNIDQYELQEAKSLALSGTKEIRMRIKELVGKREGLDFPAEEGGEKDVRMEEPKEAIDDEKMEI
ncbi:hypothetical protein K435DRAFT_710708 [Dendrothele bispora CBS 962.96]|uniref:Uncharacterized protein n=1 Tax=Dendrothele bispora (strain CBS 962.96) TaxID=1314807 RepID=A0A4S8MVE9_DENBC|nr:hypothetical protein K435DRAFT_710708 [Dendrothele bispora CBS 962.96]